MPNVNLSPYTTQQAELDRRRKLAQLLQQSSMESLAIPETPGVRISPYEGLAKILEGVIGGYSDRKLNKEQRALDTSKQSAAQEQLAKLLSSQGGTTTYQAPGAIPGTSADVTLHPDPQANAAALTSEFPQVQGLAQALMADRLKQQAEQRANSADMAKVLAGQTFQHGENEATRQNQSDIAGASKFSFVPGSPGDPYGVLDTKTGDFNQMGTRPIITPPMAPRTVTTEEGVFTVNPDGTRGAKLGNRPNPVEPAVSIPTVDDNGKPVTRVLPRSQAMGKDFPSAPTAEQQNRASALGKIDPVLTSISELSEKINTGKGIEAKAQGEAAKAAARLNYNDDVAEYEAIISGFTPMIARAVGHTGVLTQQDVDSVRALFPSPGDSKTLRDRKIARIKTVLGNSQGQPAGGVPSVGSTFNGGKVLSVTPIP